MITLIAFLLVLVGGANWLTIGLLQFDFVAGLFGSQSNIFSRIVYVLVGIGTIIITVNVIKNKGKLTFNFRKLKNKIKSQGETQTATNPQDSPQYSQSSNQNYTTSGVNSQQGETQPNTNNQNRYQLTQNSDYNSQTMSSNHNDQQYYNNNHSEQREINTNQPQYNTEAGVDNDIRSISARLTEKHNSNRNYR